MRNAGRAEQLLLSFNPGEARILQFISAEMELKAFNKRKLTE